MSTSKIVQGSAIDTIPVAPAVESVALLLKVVDGRPLNARIELLQGPNNNKQIIQSLLSDAWHVGGDKVGGRSCIDRDLGSFDNPWHVTIKFFPPLQLMLTTRVVE